MVVFLPTNPLCPPDVLKAYSTVPLVPELRAAFIHDYKIGSFARFYEPTSFISIQDRPDFYGLSHLDIRLRLDAESLERERFLLIDENTAKLHAIWFIDTQETSDIFQDWTPPPLTYPGEAYTLWQLHIVTQDFPWEYLELSGGDASIVDYVADGPEPYDPHDPQIPPYQYISQWGSLDIKKNGDEYVPQPDILASPGEWLWTDNSTLIKEVMTRDEWTRRWRFVTDVPAAMVRLTAQAAKDAGLEAAWWPRRETEEPDAGQTIKMQQDFDWDSPKWPEDGVTAGSRPNRFNRFSLGPPGKGNSGDFCQKKKRVPGRAKAHGLQRPGPVNVTTSA
ncbi:MAG: hypothetical protein Q9168_004144 [Polycauliona sp. 1 TL-2023]